MTIRDLALTLAGGGNRAFYQLGLLRQWAPRLLPRLRAVASCSAGACVATLFFAERDDASHAFWKTRRAGVTRNFEPGKLLRGERPTPHGPIYRDTLLFALAEGGLERIRALPFPLLVLAAAFPRRLSPVSSVLLGLGAYNLEKRMKPSMVHPSWGVRLGFSPVSVDARTCTTPEELADLVIASSSTPPFTPVGNFRGQLLLDGGMVDNVPAFLAEGVEGVRRNLVLLTRPYPAGSLRSREDRVYLGPTRPVPIERWDYTRPDLLDATLAMGREEAGIHEATFSAFLEEPGSGGV